jgi:hypothetical protein
MDKQTSKVRMQWRLPHAVPPQDWLRLVFKERPAANKLGALTFHRGELVAAAWVGYQVHAVPLGRSAGLRSVLTPADQATLDQWVERLAKGDFNTEITREQKRHAAAALW